MAHACLHCTRLDCDMLGASVVGHSKQRLGFLCQLSCVFALLQSWLMGFVQGKVSELESIEHHRCCHHYHHQQHHDCSKIHCHHLCAGQSWMNLGPNQDGGRNQFDDPMMTGQPVRSSASGMQFGHHDGNCMNQGPFDPTCQPGDVQGLDSIDSHHQLSSHQGVFSHAA